MIEPNEVPIMWLLTGATLLPIRANTAYVIYPHNGCGYWMAAGNPHPRLRRNLDPRTSFASLTENMPL